jgi:hypothetical protein
VTKRRNAPVRPPGRPPLHTATDDSRAVVAAMIGCGNTMAAVSRALRISEDGVMRHYREVIGHAREDVRASIEVAMVRSALGGNIGAMRTWLARFGGPDWRASMQGIPTSGMGNCMEDPQQQAGLVRFYLPSNGRDRPEPEEPTIEGEVTEAETVAEATEEAA